MRPGALILLAALYWPSHAQEVWTEKQAVQLALQQNPSLMAALRDVQAAEYGLRSAGALANPQLSYVPNSVDQNLQALQRFELNGTRTARADVASSRKDQAAAAAMVAACELVYQTRVAYAELARTSRLRDIAAELLAVADDFNRLTRRMVELGQRAGIDQIQSGIEATRARQQLATAESQVIQARARLNTFMGRQAEAPLGAVTVPEGVETVPALEDSQQQALALRSELRGARALRDSYLHLAEGARAEGYPDLFLQFTTSSTRNALSLGVSWPLFDYGSRGNRIDQAEEQARAEEERIVALGNQIRLEVVQAHSRLLLARQGVERYQQGVLAEAHRLVAASRTGLQAGLLSWVAVLEAQRTLRQVLTEYTNVLADQAIAQAALARAMGDLPALARLP